MAKSACIAAPAPPTDPTAGDPPAVDEADLLATSVARVEHRLRLRGELAKMATKLARGVTEQGPGAKAARADAPPFRDYRRYRKENTNKSDTYLKSTLKPPA
jgi:hypothetical protein